MSRFVFTLGVACLACTRASSSGSDAGEVSSEASSPQVENSGESTANEATASEEGEEAEADSDSEPSSSMSGGMFPDLDGGWQDPWEWCDIFDSESCPEGEKCTSVACDAPEWDANRCREIQGDDQVGELCEFTDGSYVNGNDTCAPGSFCFNVYRPPDLPVCIGFCGGASWEATCAEGLHCQVNGNGDEHWCVPKCDPLSQDCYPADDFCDVDESGAVFDCVPVASSVSGYASACPGPGSCADGFVCASPPRFPAGDCEGGTKCCAPLCDLDEGPDCSLGPGYACLPALEEALPALGDVGVCVVPSP